MGTILPILVTQHKQSVLYAIYNNLRKSFIDIRNSFFVEHYHL